MALWALWSTTCFSACVQRAANLLGDAGTVAAIAGQLAGAIYGVHGIGADEWGKACLANLRQWDRCDEVPLRAILLYHHGPRPTVQLRQAEGHPTVCLFAIPEP